MMSFWVSSYLITVLLYQPIVDHQNKMQFFVCPTVWKESQQVILTNATHYTFKTDTLLNQGRDRE